ncbi:MAG TPA: FAD-dependent oxidoreductase, partial [Acidiferrobacteraceae bacterium]|nr:FAD-dependent oxidoreductase [Acidiferrobacteraceae bacterium]HEX19342.1 FAD-dependent oxidoreductase [Acidiferrobacteraceae bacterium]
MADEKKVAAYICKGCGLGDRLDCGQLAQIAEREGKANLVREHDFLCNREGVSMIQNDIDNDGVTHVILAACSRRSKTEAFNFEGVAISRANLREGVIWAQPEADDTREVVQEMADDYVRMACAEAKFMQVPQSNPDHGTNKTILVVGGGISGMTAALESARAGYKVILVEKTGELGGMTAKLYKRVPDHEPYSDAQDNPVPEMIKAVEAEGNITVHLSSTISRTSGAPGQFSADISQESGSTKTENVGAIIQASGFTPYDASKLEYFGYGRSPDVVDQLGLEALARAANGGPIKRPSDGKEVQEVVFIQCAGQRSEKEGELPYCSGHCCNTSIKQAMYFKDQNPDIDAMVMYTDLRTPGNGEDFYRSAQDKGVIFTKGWPKDVSADLDVKFHDVILNEEVTMKADLVVLATGQVANAGINVEAEVKVDDKEGEDAAASGNGGNGTSQEVSILNLTYRQGKDIPQLRHGFADSHFICFPYESRRSGIYPCGPVRRPMDIAQAVDDATGAALKAIQAVENAAQGRAAHPRSGDLSFPSFRKEGCTQCKRCTVECPFGAIDEDEEGYPQFNEGRCRRCGTCMGACPVRVISFENYSVDTVGQQLKAVEVPDEFEEKPRVLVLACENDAYPALDMAGMKRTPTSPFVRVIPVRCLGSVNTIWITDAMNSGYDAVLLMGCKKGDDYQCHFVKGSEIAHTRMSKIGDTLEQLNLEKERVQTYEIAITDVDRVPR